MEYVLFLIEVHASNHLWSYQRTPRDYTFDGDHVVQVVRRQCSGIAGVEAEAASPGAIVQDVLVGLVRPCLRDGLDDLLEREVEGDSVIEGIEEQALCQLGIMVADMVEVDDEPSLILLEHKNDVGPVAPRILVVCSTMHLRSAS